MKKTVFAIHTGPVLVDVLKPLFAEIIPEVRLVNIVDDGLLTDIRSAGGLTPVLRWRLVNYGISAEAAGADVIWNCCSSVGEAADVLSLLVSIPVVKIDDAMAETAARIGNRVAVLATVATTLDPTERLVRRKAEAIGKQITSTRFLADAAFDALLRGDMELDDSMVKAEIERAMQSHDVVVLAQGTWPGWCRSSRTRPGYRYSPARVQALGPCTQCSGSNEAPHPGVICAGSILLDTIVRPVAICDGNNYVRRLDRAASRWQLHEHRTCSNDSRRLRAPSRSRGER